MKYLKHYIKKYWMLWFLVAFFLRPSRFLFEFIYPLIDYIKFSNSIKSYKKITYKYQNNNSIESKCLIILAGRGMNIQWLQIWAILGAWLHKSENYRVLAVTTKSKPIQNLYLSLFNFQLIYLENMKIEKFELIKEFSDKVNKLNTFAEFKEFEFEDIPYGKMALSTYSRQRATGITDIDDLKSKNEVIYWIKYLYKSFVAAKKMYAAHNAEMLFFTEVFMEEYGAFYYAALQKKLNIVRFAGTVRDNAIVVQHLVAESDRSHFSSLSKKSWQEIIAKPESLRMSYELDQNFKDRYGDSWSLSKRNQINTKNFNLSELRSLLGLSKDDFVAVIYSHILYDTLFFNGEDLFENYVEWLLESVKKACSNHKVKWYIKIHPSNLWRGELEHYHSGKYEEVRLIENHIGKLPDHVKLVYPDTLISPYSWLYLADVGITVRGTSGIELGALGKSVITAGTGRYENAGFTINPSTKAKYLDILSALPNIEKPSYMQTWRARRFAYATFCMKPFTLDFLKPIPITGKKRIFSSDDLIYMGNFKSQLTSPPESIVRFTLWALNSSEIDFLNPWPN